MPFATAVTDAAETVSVEEPPTEPGTITDSFTRDDSDGDDLGSGEWATAFSTGDWSTFHANEGVFGVPTAIVGIVDNAMSIRVPRVTVIDQDADNVDISLPGSDPPGLSFGLTVRLMVVSQDLLITGVTPYFEVNYGRATWFVEMGGTDGVDHGQRMGLISSLATPTNVAYSNFGFSLTTGIWYWLRWENVHGFSNKMRLWPQGTAEPSAWTLDANAFGQNPAGNAPFSIYVEQAGSASGPGGGYGVDLWMKFDDLYIYTPSLVAT